MNVLSQRSQATGASSGDARRERSAPETATEREPARSGKSWILRLGIVAVIVAAAGIGLWLANPDYARLWSRLNALVHGEALEAAEARPEAQPEEIAAPPEPAEEGILTGILSRPRLALALNLATGGMANALRPPLPPVKLSSPEIAERIGLETAPAIVRRHAPTIIGNAEIAYNANLYGQVRPRVAGIVREVIADEGSLIRQGQTMLVIDSAEIGSAKADYLAALPVEQLARQMHDMIVALRKDNAAAPKDELTTRADLNKAKAAVLNARQRLKNLGLTDSELTRIAAEQDTSTLLDVVSPLEGVVVERHAVPGEAVGPIDQVFVVADIRRMWAWIDVYESEIEAVRIGQPVTFTISGTEAPVFQGKVDWIDAAVNPATRTIRVRAEMQNIDGRLRALAFGQARIQVGPERDALYVPIDAVQDIGGERFVFEPLGDGRYQPHRVITASAEDREHVEIVSGLAPGAEVVTTGAFLLKSEMIQRRDQATD